MKEIFTKYLGPTTERGARIKAYDDAGNQILIPCPYELSRKDAHKKAALALCEKMSWPTDLIGVRTKGGFSFVNQ